jgi:hypothetical protein
MLQMAANTFEWAKKKLDRIRGILHRNVELSTLPFQAQQLHEEPDDTLPLRLRAGGTGTV